MADPLPPGRLTVMRVESKRRDPRTPHLGATYPLDESPFDVGVGCTSRDRIELFIECISRRQARFTAAEGAWWIDDDFGSTDGAFVNGERIVAKRRLRDGDQVTLGPMGHGSDPYTQDGIMFEFREQLPVLPPGRLTVIAVKGPGAPVQPGTTIALAQDPYFINGRFGVARVTDTDDHSTCLFVRGGTWCTGKTSEGTWIHGERIVDRTLAHGDRFTVAGIEFLLDMQP